MNLENIKKLALFVLVAASVSSGLSAQQTLSATVYFDYSFNVTNDGYMTGTDAARSLDNKFTFRRAYFTYENQISSSLKFRFRYDADNTGNIINAATSAKDDKLRPYIKHLYLEWSPGFVSSKFTIGMIETLDVKLEDDRWGYRSVAKTFLDIYKDVTGVDIDQTSADVGISWKGALAKELLFGAAVYNGAGYTHAENDKYKKLCGFLQLAPVSGFNIVGYMEYEDQNPTQKAVLYFADVYVDLIPNLSISGEWFTYDNDKHVNTDNSHFNVGGFSACGTYRIVPKKFNIFARYDRYQPNSMDSSQSRGLLILGADWFAWGSNARIQPNVWIYTYADSNKKRDAVFNLTFFLNF